MLLGIGPAGRRSPAGGWPSPASASSLAAGSAPTPSGTGLLGRPTAGRTAGPGLRPDRWFAAKEVRQVDRFAQFAVAAADDGVRGCRASSTPIRTGPGWSSAPASVASRPSQSQILVFDEKGPAAGLAVSGSHDDVQRRSGAGVDARRLARPVRDDRHRLCRRRPQHRVRGPPGGRRAAVTWPSPAAAEAGHDGGRPSPPSAT